MFTRILAYLSKSLFTIGTLCLFLWPASTTADPLTTFSFTGTTQSGTVVTGTYSLDLGNDSIVGPWSLDPAGFDVLVFRDFSNPFALQLVFSDPQDGGGLVLGYTSGIGGFVFSGVDFQSSQFSSVDLFASGTSTAVVTPEPSSLLLLGTALLGLAPFVRSRFARH